MKGGRSECEIVVYCKKRAGFKQTKNWIMISDFQGQQKVILSTCIMQSLNLLYCLINAPGYILVKLNEYCFRESEHLPGSWEAAALRHELQWQPSSIPADITGVLVMGALEVSSIVSAADLLRAYGEIEVADRHIHQCTDTHTHTGLYGLDMIVIMLFHVNDSECFIVKKIHPKLKILLFIRPYVVPSPCFYVSLWNI